MSTRISRVLQVSLAVLQFLTTSLPPFSESNIKSEVVGKLLLLDVFRQLEFSTEESARQQPILRRGEQCEHFILIIEGKVDHTVL